MRLHGFGSVGGAPWYWYSKVSSVAFATPMIGEAHPEFSSAGAEIYGMSNAVNETMGNLYIAEEAGYEVNWPFELYIDNQAAIAFAKNSVTNSKLKHIDCRQCWVKTVRDKNVMTPVYCNTKENLHGGHVHQDSRQVNIHLLA